MSIFQSSHNFRGKEPDEEVLLLVRRHWIKLFGPLFILFLFSILPFVFHSLLTVSTWEISLRDLYWFLAIIFWLIIWNIAFYNIMIYTLNTVIVTNKRVIENEQKGFFRYNLNELKLYNIQDISVKIYGILPAFLNYGDIEIESAGAEQDKFVFNGFPKPKLIKKTIMDLVSQYHRMPRP